MSSARPILLIPCKNKRKTFMKQAIREIIPQTPQFSLSQGGLQRVPKTGISPPVVPVFSVRGSCILRPRRQ